MGSIIKVIDQPCPLLIRQEKKATQVHKKAATVNQCNDNTKYKKKPLDFALLTSFSNKMWSKKLKSFVMFFFIYLLFRLG